MSTNLTWQSLREFGKTDSAGRWYPNADIATYFSSIRSPSRAYPHSYARAAMTKKFKTWLTINRPELTGKGL